MKVCHVTDALPGRHRIWGGAEQGCLRIVEACGAAGLEVCVAATRQTAPGSEGPAFHEVPVWETYFNRPLIWRYKLIKDFFLPFDPLAFFSSFLLFRREKPDIVHLHRVNAISFAPAIAARLLGIPTVLSVYDYWLLCPGMVLPPAGAAAGCKGYHGAWCRGCPVSPAGYLSSLLRRRLFHIFLGRINAFHALSASSRGVLARYGIDAGKINVIPIPPPPPDAVESAPVKKDRILFSGWIEPRKGAEMIVKAMPEILAAFPDAELVVLGGVTDPAYMEKLRGYIAGADIEGRVHFKGKVTAEEAASYLRGAQVVAIAEQWENMSPIVLIEAMAQGKPVVAGDIGGMNEFIEDGRTGVLVKYDSPAAYGEAIKRLLGDSAKAGEMGLNAQKRIKFMCAPEKIAGRLLEMYSGLSRQ